MCAVPLSVAQSVIGRYRVESVREIGPGVVCGVGLDSDGGRVTLVAVTITGAGHPDQALAAQDRYRIGAEGIARPVAAGFEAGELVLAYERRFSESLADRVGLTPAAIGNTLTQIAAAIAPLHDQGIAFGLIDPRLIRVGPEGVSIEGFALDAVVRELAGARVSIVPQDRRAPEHDGTNPDPVTPASDVFALGLIVTELVIGRTLSSLDARPTPRACGVDVSDEVEALISKAVARSPAARPVDVVRFAQDLAEALLRPHVPLAHTPQVEAPGAGAPPPWQAEADPASPAASPPGGLPPAASPPPAASLPPAPPPGAPPPPLRSPNTDSIPPSRRRAESAIWVLALVGGVFVMLLGVGGLFAYSLLRAPSARVPATTATTTPGPGLGPTPTAPPLPEPSDAGEGHEPDPAPDEPDAALPPPSTAPRVAGAADALSPLPITADLPVWGSDKALVTLVVFGDLECPHTRRAYRAIERILRAFPNDVRVAFRHRPLAIHSRARDAARVAVGVRREYGEAAFWRLFSQAASTTHDANKVELGKWVEAAGGRASRIEDWLSQAETESEVGRDLQLAGLFDVRETPTFFANGVRIEGFSTAAELERVIEKERSSARSLLTLGTALSELYATRVRKNLIGLGKDVADRNCPPVGSSPVRGAADALVTIVEYSDFECPFCKRVQPTLDTLLARHGGDLRIVWKNFPLDHHRRARPAAAFALEVFEQGGPTKFWKAHDLLFASQKDLSDAGLEVVASGLGMPPGPLMDAVKQRTHDAKIDADARIGQKLGVRGTPAFFVNGRSLSGALPLERFDVVVKEELESARSLVAGGTPRGRVYDALCGVR